jgi:para-aminobenzoate synthetase/4-amino-4-deoxychorismate lyase
MDSNKRPIAIIEFVDSDGQPIQAEFHQPTDIFIANSIEEVIPALQKVEAAVKQGFYAVGYVSYDAAPAFDPAFQVRNMPTMPYVWFALFEQMERLQDRDGVWYQVSKWNPDTSASQYQDAITHIKNAIAQGETYQVNYTIRLHTNFAGDAISFYQNLKRAQGGSFHAFLDTGAYQIVSVSPELFFSWKNGRLTTKPMKGTAPRGRWKTEDEQYRFALQTSEKDQAENVMIVDLLRNDMSRICTPGTVHVPKLFEVETYRTVFQMTSTIQGMTVQDISLTDLFRALFPCGSITGAPKVKTMEIISNLESSNRDVYCGTIGILKPDGEMVFNVAIRTVVIDTLRKSAWYGVGGGITWDSSADGEYQEIQNKSKVLETYFPKFGLLETIRLQNGSYVLLDRHLKRLQESSEYFALDVDVAYIRRELLDLASLHRTGAFKVRVVAYGSRDVAIEILPLQEEKSGIIPKVRLADHPINTKNLFLYHKTTNRHVYSEHHDPAWYDVLLWNERGECTEFTVGNLVYQIQGELYTPPIHCGLLAGTLRNEWIESGKLKERVLRTEDLESVEQLWLINSVRGFVPVKLDTTLLTTKYEKQTGPSGSVSQAPKHTH